MDISRLRGAVCACVLACVSATSYASGISGQGTWETSLLPRDLDGDLSTAEAYYDTDLNITWLADANYAWRWSDGLVDRGQLGGESNRR